MNTKHIIEDMQRQLKLVVRLTKELHDSPLSLQSNLQEGLSHIEETLAKVDEALNSHNALVAMLQYVSDNLPRPESDDNDAWDERDELQKQIRDALAKENK